MYYLIIKYLCTAAVVVLVSELAKRSDRLGALVAALPIVTILSLVWMHIEGQPTEKLSKHMFYTFWYVLPTLPMFLIFPHLYPRFSFWLALVACMLLSIICFLLFAHCVKFFGVKLI